MENFLLQACTEVYENIGTYHVYMEPISHNFPIEELSDRLYKIENLDEQKAVVTDFLDRFPDTTIAEAVVVDVLKETLDENLIDSFSDILPN